MLYTTTEFYKTSILLLSATQIQGNQNWATELSIKRAFILLVYAPALQDPRLSVLT